MAVIHIPSLMQDLTGGAETATVAGATLRQIVENLEAKFPGLKARLCDGDRIRTNISVWVNDEISREGMARAVGENDEIHFLPAISGG